MKQPRLPSAFTFAEVLRFCNDVLLALGEVPSLEYKTIRTVANFPITVSSKIRNIVEVRRVQSYATNAPATVVDNTDVCWRRADGGVIITELGGLTQDVDYTVILAIQGSD